MIIEASNVIPGDMISVKHGSCAYQDIGGPEAIGWLNSDMIVVVLAVMRCQEEYRIAIFIAYDHPLKIGWIDSQTRDSIFIHNVRR